MSYLQTSTLPPRMHHKLTKHGRFCKQNNQLPTKTHVELKENSIVVGIHVKELISKRMFFFPKYPENPVKNVTSLFTLLCWSYKVQNVVVLLGRSV
jgi:hypothetical protein